MDNVIKKILYSNNYDQTNKYKYIIRNCAVCGLIRLTQLKDNILNVVSDYIIEKKTFDEEYDEFIIKYGFQKYTDK